MSNSTQPDTFPVVLSDPWAGKEMFWERWETGQGTSICGTPLGSSAWLATSKLPSAVLLNLGEAITE